MSGVGKVFAEAVKQALRVFSRGPKPKEIARAAEVVRKVAEKVVKVKR